MRSPVFYRPENGHGLPHSPLNAIVSPRPIGWISSRGAAGDNLAPYSFFNLTAYVPPQLMFATNGHKDSIANIEESGVFAANIVEYSARTAMNLSSGHHPRGTDEFALAGVEKAECETIDCPRVAYAPATLECRVSQIVQLAGKENYVIHAEITGIHLRDDCVVAGRFDVTRFQPLARGGYRDYSVVREVFELARPGE